MPTNVVSIEPRQSITNFESGRELSLNVQRIAGMIIDGGKYCDVNNFLRTIVIITWRHCLSDSALSMFQAP